MRSILLFNILLVLFFHAAGQSDDAAVKKLIDETNRKIDRAVVAKDIPFLEQHYAEDYVFTHSTGLVDSKKAG